MMDAYKANPLVASAYAPYHHEVTFLRVAGSQASIGEQQRLLRDQTHVPLYAPILHGIPAGQNPQLTWRQSTARPA